MFIILNIIYYLYKFALRKKIINVNIYIIDLVVIKQKSEMDKKLVTL